MLLFVLIIVGIVTTSAADVELDPCYQNISGIYLRRFTSGSSSTNDGYALIFYFPLGGVLQFDSSEKVDNSNYFSDSAGYYQCETDARSGTATLSFSGIYFGQSGNESVNVVRSTVECSGVTSDCSDNAVQCSKGQSQSQAYEFALPDLNTGRFTNPIPNSNLSKQFESLRIYTHPTVSTTDLDKCYDEMSGVYITEYADGTYDITALSGLGYRITVYSDGRSSYGTFTRGTAMGIWYCTNSRSISGIYNYFTYPNSTIGQALIGGSYYMECPSSSYDNCTGYYTELHHPLQYQFMPFYSGQLVSAISRVFRSSRLFNVPTPQSCHQIFSGIYAFQSTIASANTSNMFTITLYRNAIFYSTGAYETNPKFLHSNAVGSWNCDSDGNLIINNVYIRYQTETPDSKAGIYVELLQLKCSTETNQCTGPFSVSATKQLELPVNGVFPSAELQLNGTETGKKLQPDISK